MKILGIGWVGTPTERVDEMAQFCENVLGLQRRAPMPGIESFDFPNGDIIEIVGPTIDMGELKGWNCPKTDFLVADVAEAREEMEEKGVEFIGPILASEEEGIAWTHFRAPDGQVYGLTSNNRHSLVRKGSDQS